ncbi:MAG: cation transporter [Spirulinaceae cyanobacterium]
MRKGHVWLVRLFLVAILWLLGLVVWVKGSLGWEARSLSLLTQSFHTLIVAFNTCFGLMTVSGADQPDGRVIYGHGQRETLLTFVLVALLAIGSFLFFWMLLPQVQAVFGRSPLPFALKVNGSLLQFVGLVSIIPLGLAGLGGYQARQLRHPILRFTTQQLFIEAILSLVLLVGLWGVWWGEVLFDLLMAVIFYLLCLDRFWQVVSWQFPLMMEQTAIAPEALVAIALRAPGVKRCDRVRARGIVGQFVYIQMTLIVDHRYESMTQNIVRAIEAELRHRYGALQVTFYIRSD